MLLRKQPAHQRRRCVVDLERALDHEAAAQVGPAACIEVRIPNLVFRVDAPLALALNPKLERAPVNTHLVLLLQLKPGIESQIRVRALVVGVHLYVCALVQHWASGLFLCLLAKTPHLTAKAKFFKIADTRTAPQRAARMV